MPSTFQETIKAIEDFGPNLNWSLEMTVTGHGDKNYIFTIYRLVNIGWQKYITTVRNDYTEAALEAYKKLIARKEK